MDETVEAAGRKVGAFVEGQSPPAERRRFIATAEIGELIAGFDKALGEIPDGRGGVLADDPATRRRALALKVRFEALDALERRAPASDRALPEEDVAAFVLGILREELVRDLCTHMTGALGYYALAMPDERPGDNEAPLGGAYARSVRQGMLAGLFESAGTLDALRDRLARRLLGESDAEPR